MDAPKENSETAAGTTPAAQDEVEYATLTSRMMASVIDSIILIVCLVPFFWLFSNFLYGELPPEKLFHEFAQAHWEEIQQYDSLPQPERVETLRRLAGELHIRLVETGVLAKMAINIAFQLGLISVAIIAFWFAKGATPGKMLLGQKIVSARTLEPASKFQLVVRYLGYFVSALPVFLGFLWTGTNRRKRGWHDIMAGTVVICGAGGEKRKKVSMYFTMAAALFVGFYFYARLTLIVLAVFGVYFWLRHKKVIKDMFAKEPTDKGTEQ